MNRFYLLIFFNVKEEILSQNIFFGSLNMTDSNYPDICNVSLRIINYSILYNQVYYFNVNFIMFIDV